MAVAGVIGTRIDRYQIESLLGAGGFGAVYRAKHAHTEAMVALKVLKRALGADAAMVERFLREARAAAAVGSEHIVRVLDAGQATDGTPFLVLELLEGSDLQGLAQQVGQLPPMRVVLLCLQVLDGLEAAHRKGIVHRDMKPANAFVVRKVDDRGTDRDFVKLLDFGISKMHAEGGSGLTMTGMAMGTPSYMAPEQFFDARSVDARADLYSVAVMMYELLAGRLPIESTSYADLIVKVKTEAPPNLSQLAPSVPKPLADVVMVGLAKEKEQRWPSAREFANALRAAMGLPVTGQTPIAPLASSAALPRASADSESMISGKTAPPRPATPAPVQPVPVVAAPTPAKPIAPLPPTPVLPGTPVPIPVPVPSAPPAVNAGWVVPQASGGDVVRPPVPPMKEAPKPGSTMKWVLIIVGVIGSMCCLCLGIGAAADQSNSNASSGSSSEKTEPEKPAPETKKAALDPNGTDIYDSLKLAPKDEGDATKALDELLSGFEVPSKGDIETAAAEEGLTPQQVKRAVALAERLRALQATKRSRALTKKELDEAQKALEALENL